MIKSLKDLLLTEINRIVRFFCCRPLVGSTLAYAAGTWLGLTFDPISPALGISTAITLIVLLILSFRNLPRNRILLYSYAIVMLAASLIPNIHPRLHFKNLPSHSSKPSFKGFIISDPETRPTRKENIIQNRFTVRIQEAGALPGQLSPSGGNINVKWYGPVTSRTPDYGEQWIITGRIEKRKTGRSVFLAANHYDCKFISAGHGSWFTAKCYAARKEASDNLTFGITKHKDVTSLLKAVLLGYRGGLSHRAREIFTSTGTLHIFAISGLHVGIITMLILIVLQRLGVSRVYWILFLAPLLTGYTLATGARPSAVRACIMAIVFYLAPLINRKSDSFSTLAFAALLIMAWNPLQLLNIGFIYTFTVVTGLLLLHPVFDDALKKALNHDSDELVPANIETNMDSPASPYLQSAFNYLRGLIALSCSAWLSSVPLTAYFFGRISLIGPVSNIIVIPLTLLIVFTGSISLVLGSCASWFAFIPNHLNLLLASALIRTMSMLAKVPWASIEAPKPDLWMVMLWYAGLSLLAMWARNPSKPQIQI